MKASLVIRNGNVIDGTGAPGFVGDVAIDGEHIVAVGPNLQVAAGCKEIDATDKLVTPGWVDVHTHYDAQATWDPLLSPSAHCGVTTAIMGNCGVGFAPCQTELRPFLLDLMEAVEDIPGTALSEGIQWDWETFPEYLDSLAKKEFACDVAVMVGHGGVRTWVLGKRANVSDMPGGPEANPVTDDEIEAIGQVVKEAVAAGALGFSTSRLLLHRDNRGVLTPGCLAAGKEMTRICDAVVEGGGGVYEMSTDFSSYDDVPYHKMDPAKRQTFMASELGWMADAMQKHKDLQVTFGTGPGQVQFFSEWAHKVSQYDGQCIVQFQTRPQSFHMSHASGKTPFSASPTYQRTRALAGKLPNGSVDLAKLIELLNNSETRAAIMGDLTGFEKHMQTAMMTMMKNDAGIITPLWMLSGETVYPWANSYEPANETMVKNMAESSGQPALEIMYDLLLDVDGPHAGCLWRPLFGYTGNNDGIVDALEYDNVIPGFDDAGAHCTILTDATCATSNISYYGRDRTVGRGTLPLEKLVKIQTLDAARCFGLHDRGVLAPGKRADLNVIDLERLDTLPPFWANDLPTNAGRWLQYTKGYVATVLRGTVTFTNDQHTGALPGRLVRNPKMKGLSDETRADLSIRSSGDEAVEDKDLTDYAVELSQGGGASALARVNRAADGKSKL